MTDTMTSQNIDLSSWDALYIYIYIKCRMETIPSIQTNEDRFRYSQKYYNQYSAITTFQIIFSHALQCNAMLSNVIPCINNK